MKRGSTLFLKIVLVLIGLAVLSGLLWFPQTEGRVANLDIIGIYADPFIAYIYVSSIPFFVALYQAFKLLEFIEKRKAFSQKSVDALKNIKYCAVVIVGLLAVAIGWLRFGADGNDDPAGVMAIGIMALFASTVVATAAAVFQSLLQNAVDLKSENDLTV